MNRACPNDHFLSDEALCPQCGTPTKKSWSGLLTVINAERSDLAEAMNVTQPGNYALKVR